MSYTRKPELPIDVDKLTFAEGPGANPVTEPDPTGLKQVGYKSSTAVSADEVNWLHQAGLVDLREALKGGALPVAMMTDIIGDEYLDKLGKSMLLEATLEAGNKPWWKTGTYSVIGSDGIRLAGYNASSAIVYCYADNGDEFSISPTYCKHPTSIGYGAGYLILLGYDGGGNFAIETFDPDDGTSVSYYTNTSYGGQVGGCTIRQDGQIAVVAEDTSGDGSVLSLRVDSAGSVTFNGELDSSLKPFGGVGLTQNMLFALPESTDNMRVWDCPWNTTSAPANGRDASSSACYVSSGTARAFISGTDDKVVVAFSVPVGWEGTSNIAVAMIQQQNGTDTLYTTRTATDVWETVWKKSGDSATWTNGFGVMLPLGFVLYSASISSSKAKWWIIDTTHQGRLIWYDEHPSLIPATANRGSTSVIWGGAVVLPSTDTGGVEITLSGVQGILLGVRAPEYGISRVPVTNELVPVNGFWG